MTESPSHTPGSRTSDTPRVPARAPNPEITIRPVESRADMDACVELQRRTWGEAFSEVVPVSMLQITAKMGGVAVGAFDREGGLVGLVYGISGFRHGRPAHWSHMLAVRPEARNLGVGRRLKMRQKEMLLALGVETMYWTFDPLVSRNAHLNLNRLGARVAEYVPDMYGASNSELHQLGTDRFVVEWTLRDEDGQRSASPDSQSPTHRRLAAADPTVGSAVHAPASVPPPPDAVEVPIPADIEAVERRSVEEAQGWRASTRQAFVRLLSSGHEVVGFVPGAEQSKYIVAPSQPTAQCATSLRQEQPSR